MKNLVDIVKDLGIFINWLDTMDASHPIGKNLQKHEHLSCYWKDVKDDLGKPMELELYLKYGFWLQSRVFASMVD